MWKVGFVPNSNALNWIVPYSSVSNLNCASFQDHQSKLCLSPITQNWSVPNSNLPQWLVPYSNVSKLNCALFQCPTIEYCLVPMPSKWIVPYSNVAKWNVPYSNAIKLSCALFQYHKMKCALFLFHQNRLRTSRTFDIPDSILTPKASTRSLPVTTYPTEKNLFQISWYR